MWRFVDKDFLKEGGLQKFKEGCVDEDKRFKALEDIFRDFSTGLTDYSVMTLDKDGNTVCEIECPGFNKDNLSIDVIDGILTVKGECGKRKVFRKFDINGVDDVDASAKDGILTLVIKKPKKVSVKVEVK